MKKIFLLFIGLVFFQHITMAQVGCKAYFFYYQTQGTTNITFVDSSYTTSKACNYAGSYFSFGNGTVQHFSYSTNHTVTFSPGTYQVCLYITDSVNTGCRDTMCQTVVVTSGSSSTCSSLFTAANNGSSWYFTPTSWGGVAPYTYQWSIYDTIAQMPLYNGSLTNPSVVLPANHYMVVTLWSTDSAGCVSTTRQIVGLNTLPTNPACNALFVLFPDSTNTHNYYGYNYSTGSNLHYFWNWGDGSFDTSAYPVHQYQTAGFYTVCLSVYNNSNCADSQCVYFNVNRMNPKSAMHSISILKKAAAPSGMNKVVAKTALTIYPNPATDELTIDLNNEKIESAKIISINGQMMWQNNSTTNKINISALPANIYFVEIKTAENVYRSRFVKE